MSAKRGSETGWDRLKKTPLWAWGVDHHRRGADQLSDLADVAARWRQRSNAAGRGDRTRRRTVAVCARRRLADRGPFRSPQTILKSGFDLAIKQRTVASDHPFCSHKAVL